jgi:hypothetical protein
MFNPVQYKQVETTLLNIDKFKGEGLVEIAINSFDNLDYAGDISHKHSFDETIVANFKIIKHYLNHDLKMLLGVPLELKTTESHLIAKSLMNTKKTFVNDVYLDYLFFKELNDGRTLYHSIGYSVEKRDKKDERIIMKYNLLEYSTLSAFPANINTPTIDVKQYLDNMHKYNYSDTRKREVDQYVKTAQIDWQKIITTFNTKKP